MPPHESIESSERLSERVAHSKMKLFLKVIVFGGLLTFVLGYLMYFYIQHLNQPPVNFPQNELIIIEPGMTARAITELLAELNVVKSKTLLYYTLVFQHDPSGVKASTYRFNEPLTTFEIASRISQGEFDSDLVRLTHIEGERAAQLAIRANELLPKFDRVRFVQNAEAFEGRLWPETYFVPPQYTDEDVLVLLLNTFTTQISPYEEMIQNHSLNIDEILILASIIEREANSPESKRLVSGVLQNRIEIGMPLQADASIEYVLDKPLAELIPEDLKIDSPYNTYINPGLPPTPIGNPGLDAILAVLEPTDSDYFYYITDSAGVFYFAKTYGQHLDNIERYLR